MGMSAKNAKTKPIAASRALTSEVIFDAGREWFMNEDSVVNERALDRFVLNAMIGLLPAETREVLHARVKRGP
jgi:hypothetical protein